eukprot:10043758-Lingulodinium_polyedra.AAC.1
MPCRPGHPATAPLGCPPAGPSSRQPVLLTQSPWQQVSGHPGEWLLHSGGAAARNLSLRPGTSGLCCPGSWQKRRSSSAGPSGAGREPG